MYDEAPTGLSRQPNGSISYVGPGDVVSMNVFDDGVFEADGHVGVANTAGRVTSGQVDIVSQNSGDAAVALLGQATAIPNPGWYDDPGDSTRRQPCKLRPTTCSAEDHLLIGLPKGCSAVSR